MTSYGYNGFDRLLTTTYPGGSYEQHDAHPVQRCLGLDGTGVLGQILGPNGSSTPLDCGGQALVTEVTSDGTVSRYVYGSGSDELLVWYNGSGITDRRYPHADERGSIVAINDNGGNAMRINTYGEYGIPGAGTNHTNVSAAGDRV